MNNTQVRAWVVNHAFPTGKMFYSLTWDVECTLSRQLLLRMGATDYKERDVDKWEKEIKFMFSPGLMDKNGNRYYFDDIVKTPLGIGVLVWHEDRLGIASGEIGNYHAIDSISKQYLEQYEAIGNIHQHAHLLQ